MATYPDDATAPILQYSKRDAARGGSSALEVEVLVACGTNDKKVKDQMR